ncbi:MAG: purine-nucleoside phosphorylase [Ardenticatenales bacterium]|nr:purine-nucleoside phosphorylase [Ardenticatenales bacterium]
MERAFDPTHAVEAAAWIRGQMGARAVPMSALITGSGLGMMADSVQAPVRFPTTEIPHWPQSTVEGHAGRLVVGSIAGHPVIVMQGRVHFYEGYPIQQVAFPIRVLQALGVQRLIVTNAAGGMEKSWAAGDIMLIRDHINVPGMAGQNPLIGPNNTQLGPRFPSMANAYDPTLRALAHEVAREQGLTLREGIYAMVSGPSYETPAELRFLHVAGAHAVGMSTAPEVIVARHAGMTVLGFSLLTNMVLFDPTAEEETTHDEVLEVGALAAPRLVRLLEGILTRWATS